MLTSELEIGKDRELIAKLAGEIAATLTSYHTLIIGHEGLSTKDIAYTAVEIANAILSRIDYRI